MKSEKNKLMHYIAGAVVVLAMLFNTLGRYFHLFNHSHGGGHIVSSYDIEAQYSAALNILLFMPLVLFAISIFLYQKNKNHPYIPYLLTLVLTFSSMAIISGGSGRVEFHFSIFMVVAALGYYQEIKLLLIMTSLFAIQHIAGLLIFPELIFGVHHYTFFMLLLHAIFLVLTSSAVSWQVHSNKKIEDYYKKKQHEQRNNIIEDIVGRLSVTSDQVLHVSESLSFNAKQSIEQSSQLAVSIGEVASGTEHQMNIIESNMNIISEINKGIQEINQTAQMTSKKSHLSAQEAQKGSQLIESLLTQMKEINQNVEVSFTTIKELHLRSQSIESIIGVITNIADQTNLLALNAAIEAARAGEYGKGFSVVANEVKKLAEQSLDSSKNISEIIKQILEESSRSVESMINVKSSATDGLEIAQHSNKVFHQISEASMNVAAQIQEISSLVEYLNSSSGKVNEAMRMMYATAEQSAASTKEITIATEQQHELTENTFQVSKELNDLTNELGGVISKLRD
ncbi:hypothetical protein F9802_03340 [Bacillus aerolatus]|uniref:Methyl-accepting transducer domain-containing protein n=1 Tax=Bacillus aerolatus TaxID=2653354 RepID=A0A6I1FW43_9BACI|nr:methyl-accepting chemotaxis protein [Bacillus aerolatus]KAB7709153.1 hypothetical protein F9802_03340 [Bacillus aerolatus]